MKNKKVIHMEVTIAKSVLRDLDDTEVPHVEVAMGEVMFFLAVFGASPYKETEKFAQKIRPHLRAKITALNIRARFGGREHWFEHKFEKTYEHDYYSGQLTASSAEEAKEEMIDDVSSAKMVTSYTNEYYEGEVIASSPEEALEEMIQNIHSLSVVEVSNE